MKKKLLGLILAICLFIPSVIFLGACDIKDERTYMVTFKNNDGTIISEKEYAKSSEIVFPENPTKPADNTYTYTFNGWDIEIPDKLTGDLIITATYTTNYIEYSLSIPNNVTVSKGQTELSLTDTLHYGDIIIVTYEETTGFAKTNLQITGATATSNENEYQVTGDVSIVYEEQNIEYTLTIPEGVDVSENSKFLTSTDTLHYGDLIIVSPNDNYIVEDLLVSGVIATSNENEYQVIGNVNITATITSAVSLTVTTDVGTNEYKIKKNDTIADALTFSGVDITDNNSIGFYSDANYTTPIANSTALTGDTTIYTVMATLDKLTLDGTIAKPKNSWIRGTLVIPKSITTIRSFSDCNELTQVIMPDSIIDMGAETFYGCYSLKYVRLPQGIDCIGMRAFADCRELLSVNIPEGVTTISVEAFENCFNLNMVSLPNSLQDIGIDAFAFCHSLRSIKIPQNVTTIGESAFWHCFSLIEVFNLSSLNIEKGSDSFGYVAQYAKDVCTYGTASSKIQLIDDVYYYVSEADFIAVGIKDKYIYENLTLSEKTTEINRYAFNRLDCRATITIPGSVKTIGQDAFYKASISKIVIEEGLEELQTRAFAESDIHDIKLPNSLITIGANSFDSSLITSITIPNNVKTIGDRAFKDSYLERIEIPDSVETIGDLALDIAHLVRIDVDENNKNYSSVDGVLFNKDKTKLLFYPARKTGESYEIPLSVTTILCGAFDNCSYLTSIIITENVTEIGEWAFETTSIITVTINSTSIATALIEENSYGHLIREVETVYVLASIVDVSASTYLLENFTKQATSDKDGYDMYVRNSTN